MIGVASLCLRANVGDEIPCPVEFWKWVHIKTELVGPQSPFFETGGGIHHVYAIPKAMEGFQTGKFPDGAVLVFDLLEAKETNGRLWMAYASEST